MCRSKRSLHAIHGVTSRIILKHAGHRLIAVLSEKTHVPVKCFKEHSACAVFCGLPLKLAEQPGADPLPPVRFVHPERIDIRAVPSVYAADKTGNDPAVLVSDLFPEGNVFVFARREGFVVLAQPAGKKLRDEVNAFLAEMQREDPDFLKKLYDTLKL